MTISKPEVWKELRKLNFHYPESGHTRETLTEIAVDYWSDLSEEIQTDHQFINAVKQARKVCKFFPKISDIIDAHRKCIQSNPERNILQLEDVSTYHDPTEKELAINKKRIEILQKVISKKITMEEGEKLQEELLN